MSYLTLILIDAIIHKMVGCRLKGMGYAEPQTDIIGISKISPIRVDRRQRILGSNHQVQRPIRPKGILHFCFKDQAVIDFSKAIQRDNRFGLLTGCSRYGGGNFCTGQDITDDPGAGKEGEMFGCEDIGGDDRNRQVV